MKNVVAVLLVWSMAVSVFGQTTPSTAREILGKKFIEVDEARQSWSVFTNRHVACIAEETFIPFSRDILSECAQKNHEGKSDYYLVPIMGLTNSELISFWKIESNCLPLQTSIVGWRLINFFNKKDLYFSWDEEVKRTAQQGVKILSASDYLEAVATIYLTRSEEKTSNFTIFYFSPRAEDDIRYANFLSAGAAIAYSADVGHREAVVVYFPRENFVPLSIRPNEFSFVVFGDNQNDAVVFEFKRTLRSFTKEIRYDVSVIENK